MGRHRKERPDGCVIYASALRQILFLPDDSAGRIIKAAAELFLEGVEPEGFDLSESIVFSLFRDNIGETFDKFYERCARNKDIADSRTSSHDSSPVLTTRHDSLPGAPVEENRPVEENKIEMNQIEEKADKPPARFRFSPPSLEEVRAYCKERGNALDPQRFLDFYTANGWRVGKNPMKDWKAAVRTWEGRDEDGYSRNDASTSQNAGKRFDIQYDVT